MPNLDTKVQINSFTNFNNWLVAIACGSFVFLILPALFTTLIGKSEEQLKKSEIMDNYGYLYSENKIETPAQRAYNLLFLSRRLLIMISAL